MIRKSTPRAIYTALASRNSATKKKTKETTNESTGIIRFAIVISYPSRIKLDAERLRNYEAGSPRRVSWIKSNCFSTRSSRKGASIKDSKKETRTMKILALDLGKYKTMACDYEAETGRHQFATIPTNPKALHDLIVDREPQRVVVEICSIAGWVCDLVRSLGIELQVASTNDERWQWRKVKTKNDRADALKLAQFSARNELNLVHVPQSEMRQLIHSLGQDISVLDFVFHTRFVMLP